VLKVVKEALGFDAGKQDRARNAGENRG